jgi:hypothetical protein
LTNKLLNDHHFTNGHLGILAELFFAEATLSEAQNKPDHSLDCYEKSLILLKFLEQDDKTWSAQREERKSQLKERITVLKLN